MCGIAGWIDFDRDLTLEHRAVGAMTEALHHRGPDAGGLYLSRHAAFGHRRLVVIDRAGGSQPMADTHVVLSYNGAVYNFAALRNELASHGHEFGTRSDTEVVLKAYRQWGVDLAVRLDGMFALAIWDVARRELILVRDRLGLKPLYYYRYENGLVFGSEPKAVFANPLYTPSVDEADLPVLLNARLGLPGATPLHGLRRFCPATSFDSMNKVFLRPATGASKPTTMWTTTPRLSKGSTRSIGRLGRELSRCGCAHCKPALRGPRLQCARRPGTAYCSPPRVFGRLRESLHSDTGTTGAGRSICAARGATPRSGTYRSHVGWLARALESEGRARAARDLPSLGEYDASLYLLCVEVRKHATVALCGEGADEIFGGYPWFRQPEHVWSDSFPWINGQSLLSECLAPDVRGRVEPGRAERDLYSTLVAQTPCRRGDSRLEARMREVLYVSSLCNPLWFLLDRQDRMSMAVGLEVRVPYCDHRLVEYVWNVPWSMKNADGRGKTLLRDAVADLLPAEIRDRRKSLYPSMVPSDYAYVVVDRARRMLRDPASPLRPALDPVRVGMLAKSAPHSLPSVRLLDRFVRVDAWMRDYRIAVC